MSKANTQALTPRSSTPPRRSSLPLPYSNKEEAKKWLEYIISIKDLPQVIHERAVNLDRKINIKGKSWDDLKDDLQALHNDLQKAVPSLQIGMNILGVPPDPRLDLVIQKLNELGMKERLKTEIEGEMENIKKRLKSDIEENYDKIDKLRKDVADRDDTIRELRAELRELTVQKEKLEKQIKTLTSEIEDLKNVVGKLQIAVAEKDQNIEKLMQIHANQLEKVNGEALDMKRKIKELQDRNEELAKMNESRILVGETMKKMIKAMYKHVHPTLPLRKKAAYAIREIGEHMTRYTDFTEKQEAQDRWHKLKGKYMHLILCTLLELIYYHLHLKC